MIKLKEIEKMDSKDIYTHVSKKQKELTILKSKVFELENALVPWNYVLSLRSIQKREKDQWEEALQNSEK